MRTCSWMDGWDRRILALDETNHVWSHSGTSWRISIHRGKYKLVREPSNPAWVGQTVNPHWTVAYAQFHRKSTWLTRWGTRALYRNSPLCWIRARSVPIWEISTLGIASRILQQSKSQLYIIIWRIAAWCIVRCHYADEWTRMQSWWGELFWIVQIGRAVGCFCSLGYGKDCSDLPVFVSNMIISWFTQYQPG
jgi:hypothetical protein